MNLTQYMKINGICIGLELKDKNALTDVLSALHQRAGATTRYKTLRGQLMEQEGALTSAIGAGVAIAQVRSSAVKTPSVTMVTLVQGVDYDAPDEIPVRLAFFAAIPLEAEVDLGARLSVLLLDENLREQLMAAADEETALEMLCLAEAGKYGGNREEETPLVLAALDAANEEAPQAAAVLQKTAGRQGILLRVEFFEKKDQKEHFTAEELQEAKGVLLMGSINPDLFDGKPLLRAGITDGIYRPEHLLNHATKAPVYHRSFSKKGKGFWSKMKQNRRSHKAK